MSEHFITWEEQRTVRRTRKVTLSFCPFCGGAAEFRNGGNYCPREDRRMGVGVRCTECKAQGPLRQGEGAQLRVAELWNRRAQP